MEHATIDRDTLVRPGARPPAKAPAMMIAHLVERGDQRGRELGSPTANLPIVERL
jgi:Riboflavin kinase